MFLSRLVLLALCWGLSVPALAAQISMQINWKHQFEFAAFYAALQQGYYREAGLDVVIREGGPGVDAVKEVVEGRADFGVGTSALVVQRHEGKPVVAVASLMQHSPIALLALRRNGVSSVHDLADRPVAVDPHSRDEIDAYMRAAGVPAKQIRLVDQTDWTLASLEVGREAAKVVYVSNEPFFTRGREHEFILLRPQSAGIDLFGNILFTTRSMVDKHRHTVQAFRDATLKGLVYALAHPEELADLILADYNTQNKSREHLLFEAREIRDLTRPDIVEPGYMSPGRWRHVARIYASQGKLPHDVDLDGLLFEDPPPGAPTWLMPFLLAALAGLLVAGLVAVKFRRLNADLAERERLLSAIVDNEPECVKLLDAEGRLLQMNRAGLNMIEADTEAQAVGGPLTSIVLPAHRKAFDDLTQRVFAGESGTLAFQIVGLKGGRRWLETHAVPLRDEKGQITRLLAVTQDITARRQADTELERYRLGLEEQVQARTAELEASRNEAQRLMRAKSEFLANMSHEIRTPLNAVLGFARIGARHSADATSTQAFGRIRDAGGHLLAVINDILDFSKLDAGKVRFEPHPFEFRAVLSSAASLVAGAATEKGLSYTIEITPDLPEWVMGDAQRLQQILVNLLSNAVKFTPQGAVKTRATRDGDQVCLTVIDDGIGMTAEQLARLFKPFEQADNSTTRQFGGSGLGLVISRDLARLMGGEITVDSIPGQGSAFSLRLPLPAVEPPTRTDAEGTAGPRLNGIHVLVAEDVEVNRMVLESLLTDDGARVTFAEHGQQAIERLQEMGASAFDVVLMDVQMPVMDGFEATRRIRALAPCLPVIGLTAHAMPEERQRCLDAGMCEHLTKPIDNDELVAAILRHVSGPAGGEPKGVEGDSALGGKAPGLIDWPALLARFGNRRDFVETLLRSFLVSQSDTPARLRNAARANDLQAVAFLSHSLRGEAGELRAVQLSAQAFEAESAAHAGSDEAFAIADALADALDAFLKELVACELNQHLTACA